MKKLYTIFRVCALLCLLSVIFMSCNFTGKLTRRYKSMNISDQKCSITNYVMVESTIIEKDPGTSPAARGLLDLTDKGQSMLIDKVAAKEALTADMIKQLRNDLAVPPDRSIPEIITSTRFTKRISATVSKVPFQPGDRIEKVLIKITVNDPNLRLLSCNRIVTEYMNLDLGKLNYANSNAIELSGNASVGSEVVDAYTEADKNTSSEKYGDQTLGSERSTNNGLTRKGVGSKGVNGKFTASRSFSEEVQLRQRIVGLNAFIKDNAVYFYQEGISGIDLIGNILADVVCEYVNDISTDKVYTFEGLFNAAGTPAGQAAVVIKENILQGINLNADITANVQFEAAYRRITAGARTVSESDDEVTYYTGSTISNHCSPQTITFVPRTAFRANSWRITYDSGGGVRLPLHICNAAGQCGEILFRDYKNAVEFARWLRTNATINLAGNFSAANYVLRRGDNVTQLTIGDIQTLRIELNQ